MNKLLTMVLFAIALSLSGQSLALTILTEDDAPYNYLDENKKPAGLTMEIVQEIQRRLGNADRIEFQPWARAYYTAQNEPNVVLFSMARTKERNELFHWVGPFIENRWLLIAKANSPVRLATLDDARKVGRIGVYRDDSRDAYLTRLGFTNLERTVNNQSAVKMLMAGRTDLLAIADNTLPDGLKSAGFDAKDVKSVLSFQTVQLFIAISRGTAADTVAAWQKAFDSLSRDGTLKKLIAKYLPDQKLPGPAITSFE